MQFKLHIAIWPIFELLHFEKVVLYESIKMSIGKNVWVNFGVVCFLIPSLKNISHNVYLKCQSKFYISFLCLDSYTETLHFFLSRLYWKPLNCLPFKSHSHLCFYLYRIYCNFKYHPQIVDRVLNVRHDIPSF